MRLTTRIPEVPATALDIFKMLPEGTRAEVIDNVLYMSPSPFFKHQQLVTKLAGLLWNRLEQTNNKGILLVSPFDVYLEHQASAVQPDLLFISPKNKRIIKDDGYAHGTPDLVIEILSKNEQRDRKLKKGLYERAGVKEYFIIDPKTKMTEAFVSHRKKFTLDYTRKKYFCSGLLRVEFDF